MRTTIIGGTIQTTVLGFGCASLFRLPSRRQRRRVLDAAFDAGIRHYDVAPMYGLGLAEPELAAFARAHPNTVVVATKFGIDPGQLAGGLAHLQGPIRRVLARAPALQRGAMSAAAGPRSGPLGKLLYRWRGYDPAAARTSLQRSLRRLRKDSVDLFLLHDPTPKTVPTDDLGAWLEDARTEGLIRAWGVAAPTKDALNIASRLGASTVLQIPFDGSPRLESSAPMTWHGGVITFGVVGKAMSHIAAAIGRGDDRAWSEAVGFDLADPEAIATMLLRDAVSSNPLGVVLFSTTRPERIGAAVRVLEDTDNLAPERLAPFRAFLADVNEGRPFVRGQAR